MKRSESFTSILLTSVVIGGIIIIAATNPYFGIKAIGAIQKELKRRKWKNVKDNFHYLKRKGLVQVNQNSDGSFFVKATKAGRERIKKYNLDKISIETPKQWDKNWRLVVFDIPAKKYKARFALLAKLKNLNFIMLQKSIWVHPFECQNEISVLAKAFEVEQYIHQITCHQISAGEQLCHEFEERNGIKLV